MAGGQALTREVSTGSELGGQLPALSWLASWLEEKRMSLHFLGQLLQRPAHFLEGAWNHSPRLPAIT